MQVGLLWYDSDPRRTLEDKVGRAAQRYHEKYGRWPDTCYVHPTAMVGRTGSDLVVSLGQNPRAVIRVKPASNVLVHHLWLGVSMDAARELRQEAVG